MAGLTPRTADQVAVQARELGIVQQILASGRVLEEVVRGASPERLAAIAANAEVLPEVLRSDDPASVIEGVHARVFEALVEAGHPQAVIAAEAKRAFDEQSAWRDVIRDTIEGQVTGSGLTSLWGVDPEAVKALQASATDPVRDADTAEAVRKLDHTFGVGQAQPQTAGA